MFKRKTKGKSSLSNTAKYPAVYYRSKRLFIALIVVASVAATIGVVFTYDYFNQNNKYTLTYTCEGVDSEWLKDHPFDSSSFPAELKRKDSLILHAPQIENYRFIEWKIKWNDTLSMSASSTFKDGEPYKATNSYFVSIFNNKASVIAKYTKK